MAKTRRGTSILDTTLQANGQLSILSEPLRYSALLFTSCKNERKATEFLQFHMRQHPESSTKAIRDAFLERFQSEVRNNAAKARDAFFSRHIRMSMGMSVQDYASLFRQQLVHIPEMHENDRIRWFQQGLTPQLRTECIVDQNGSDFTSLDNLIKFAVGQERRKNVMQQNNPRFPPRFNYTQAVEEDGPSKKQKTGDSDSSQQQPSAAPMAGTSARGRGSIRGGSSGRGRHSASANAAPSIRGGGVAVVVAVQVVAHQEATSHAAALKMSAP